MGIYGQGRAVSVAYGDPSGIRLTRLENFTGYVVHCGEWTMPVEQEHEEHEEEEKKPKEEKRNNQMVKEKEPNDEKEKHVKKEKECENDVEGEDLCVLKVLSLDERLQQKLEEAHSSGQIVELE